MLNGRDSPNELTRGASNELPIVSVCCAQCPCRSTLNEVVKCLSENKHAHHAERITFRDTSDRPRIAVYTSVHQDSTRQLKKHSHPSRHNLEREAKTDHQSLQQLPIKDIEALGNVKDKACQRFTSRNLLGDKIPEESPDRSGAKTR